MAGFIPHAPLALRSQRTALDCTQRRARARVGEVLMARDDADFFVGIGDLDLLRGGLKKGDGLGSVAERRAREKRGEIVGGLGAARGVDDDDEVRRRLLVDEVLNEGDLFGIVGGEVGVGVVGSDGGDVVGEEGGVVHGGVVSGGIGGGAVTGLQSDGKVKKGRKKKGRKWGVGSAADAIDIQADVVDLQADGISLSDIGGSVVGEGVVGEGVVGEGGVGGLRGEVDIAAGTATARSAFPPLGPLPADVPLLRAGDLVKHSRHGIGRFRGLERTVSQVPRHSQLYEEGAGRPVQEFAVVEYRDGDVYVPLSQMECLEKLSDNKISTVRKLDVISGSSIYSDNSTSRTRRSRHIARSKTRSKIRKQLVNLHGMYAERASLSRVPIPADLEAEKEFESRCKFQLTDDQILATQQVRDDLTKVTRPMDRLLVGDVGFGKTEVAIRAAFRVLKAGRQVAILAPTTILAQQHFETFTERFADAYPEMPISCLTRFTPRKKLLEARQQINEGVVRLAIGTHMLLSDHIMFKDLGLLIVDEEHRFGVNQKEKFRCRYRAVDTLFLSATPIPRTLHLALSGLRDTSVLSTPPPGRKPVITRVSPSGAGIVRTALEQELKRDGQTFFVVPRIEGIEACANWIRDILPDIRVLVAHGSSGDLERRIWAFAQHEYDVLVCTTIIENGINMPNVNTLIIQDAGRFGMGALHQIRGRIGRCDIQAYAYLMYSRKPVGESTPAFERLKALEKFSGLGSGFAIAQRDMEMRGVGTVLGVDQHGNSSIGAEDYAKMLAEELEHARTGEPIPITLPTSKSIEIFLPVASLIPAEYIADFDQKMVAYGYMSAAKDSDELRSIVENLEQQYGPLPTSTRRHVSVLELKVVAKTLGISRVFTERQHVILDWALEEGAFSRLVSFLPDEQSRSRFQHVVAEERVIVRGLGVCTGDVQLAKLRSYLHTFGKAAEGILRGGRIDRPSETGLAQSLLSLEDTPPLGPVDYLE